MKYDDIINIPRPTLKHKRMSEYDRAAQFAPFAALTGYAESINEAGRIVDKRLEMTEEEKAHLDMQLQYIIENIDTKIKATFIYFIKDKTKEGGIYDSITGVVRKINLDDRYIMLEDKTKIDLMDLYSIKGVLNN